MESAVFYVPLPPQTQKRLQAQLHLNGAPLTVADIHSLRESLVGLLDDLAEHVQCLTPALSSQL